MKLITQNYTREDIGSGENTLYFGKDSHSFKTYRLNYPKSLILHIMPKISSSDYSTCIDVGSGAGHSCKWLLKEFNEVLAIEPDQNLADCIEPHPRLRVLNSRAEQTIIDQNSADLVTCATAFHWLDAQAALDKIHFWLKDKGMLAVYQYRMPKGDHPVFSIIEREMNDSWKPFQHKRLLDKNYSYREISKSQKFSHPDIIKIPYTIQMDAEHLIGFLLSTSFVGRFIRSSTTSSNQMEAFIKQIRLLCKNEPLVAQFEIELITATPRKTLSHA